MATARRRQAAAVGAAVVREWAAVSCGGAWRVEEVGKHHLMRRTGLTPRDLRTLDPALSYPSSILGRERAVVVHLEHARAVVTASEVLVPNPRDPAVAPLVQELRARLASTPGSSPTPPHAEGEVTNKETISSSFHGGEGSQKGYAPLGSSIIGRDRPALGSDKVLPFEFRALEVCLESVCKSLELETSALEKEAYPALDELTSEVSTLNLERVRQIKNRLVAISGRVQKVRDELEHLLDDDMDMAAMHLSEKIDYQAAGLSSIFNISSRFDKSSRFNKSPRFNPEKELTESDGERDEEIEEEEEKEGPDGSNKTSGFRPNIDELEILLEAYFVQIDGTLQKLSTLQEYVDDTEDYINIMLDDKQNQLLQMGIMLSTAALVIGSAITVTGIFGINIHIPIYEAPVITFWQTTCGLIGACIALYVLALLFYRRSGILQ